MGIRGAWSLISKDPRRYGCPWVSRNETQERSILFFDGPSLLYHLYTTGRYDPSELIQQDAGNMVSPDVINRRAIRFFSLLISSFEEPVEVHIVMDGLAPESKILTQAERLNSMAVTCDQIARCHRSIDDPKRVPLHVFAETAMLEALIHVKLQHKDFHIHHPIRGEAETFIAQYLEHHRPVTQKVVILSDDTDFLIYPSCPGFIPFRTLQFQTISGEMCLTGFMYLRSRFISSFLPSGEGMSDSLVMTTVASLAGCDYTLSPKEESALRTARIRIVQSNIGGLRQRQRNAPSRWASLTAIVRFAAHYYTSNTSIDTLSVGNQGSPRWLVSLASAVCNQGNGQGQRMKTTLSAFNRISAIYMPFQHVLMEYNVSRPLLQTSFARLVVSRKLFCPPIIETWEGDRGSATWQTKAKRHKQRHTEKLASEDSEDHQYVVEPDCATSAPLSWQLVNSGSMWQLPCFCQVRLRLYSLLHDCAKSGGSVSTPALEYHTEWDSRSPKVSEFQRVGTKSEVSFTEREVSVPIIGKTHEASFSRLVLFCVLGRQPSHSEEKVLEPLTSQKALIFLASLMLHRKVALVLVLVGTLPPGLIYQGEISGAENSLRRWKVLELIEVACFHAALVMNGARHLVDTEAGEGIGESGEMTTHQLFRKDLSAFVRDILLLQEEDMDHDPSSTSAPASESTSMGCINDFFQRFACTRRSFDASAAQTATMIHWQNSAVDMWNKRLVLDCENEG